MKLVDCFKNTHVGLNFNIKCNSQVLSSLGFVDVRINIDMRVPQADRRYYERVNQYVKKGDVVFIVPSLLNYQNPVLISIILGITGRLPYIVYFMTAEDPNLTNPLVRSLEEVRWKSEQAAILDHPVGFFA